MAFVESIASKFLDEVEDFAGLIAIDPVLEGAVDKDSSLLGHLLGLLLTHGAAHDVGIAEAVSGEDLRRLHDLFLVDDDAVGLFEDALKPGVEVGHLTQPMLTLDKLVHHA